MDNKWWWAAAFITGGLLLGTLAGITARRILDRPTRRPAIRQAARPAAAFLFWLLVAAGLIAAVASASPDTLEPIPSDLLAWLPRAGIAGLILIGGFVAAAIISAGVARAAARATGNRQPLLESSTRIAVISAAAVLALTQLGVDTTILNILVAAVAFGATLALAGIAITGGRHVAQAVAAGRTLSPHLRLGDRITIGDQTGTLEQLTATHAVLTVDTGDTAIVTFGESPRLAVTIHSAPDSAATLDN
jgi:small-conductance mechanosensitive channel